MAVRDQNVQRLFAVPEVVPEDRRLLGDAGTSPFATRSRKRTTASPAGTMNATGRLYFSAYCLLIASTWARTLSVIVVATLRRSAGLALSRWAFLNPPKCPVARHP